MCPLAALKNLDSSQKSDNLRYDLSSHLKSLGDKRPFRSIATSITRNTIVLVSMDEAELGSQLALDLGGKYLILEVAECNADPQHGAIFHVLLRTGNPAYHLPSLLEELLGEAASHAEPKLSFEMLREAIGRAGNPDRGTVRNFGLAAQEASQTSYMIQYRGHSLIVLMPNTIQPASVIHFSDAEAKEHLVIMLRKRLKKADSRWVKIWPVSE